jgi:predicted ATPase
MRRIVLTGGPSGGKSTTIMEINRLLPEVYCAPEVATILLSGGFPAPNQDHPWSYDWQWKFQTAVAGTQLALEEISEQRARAESKRVIVYDRGLLDGASYLQFGVRDLETITQQTEQQMADRYDHVLHLPSSATRGLDGYDKLSNPHRFEEAAEALALEKRVLEVWSKHADRQIIDGNNKDEVVHRAVGIVAAYTNSI